MATPPGTVGERLTSVVMPYQIRTVSKLRLLEPFARINDPALQEAIESRLLEHLDIAFEAESS